MRLPVVSVIHLSLLALLLLPTHAKPPFTTLVTPAAISGADHPIHRRWRATVATVARYWKLSRSHSREPLFIHSPLSGPLSAVYRSTLSASRRCLPTREHTCHVAPNSFANVGQTTFRFNDLHKNIAGTSRQLMIGCRCLSSDCGLAILVRPVHVMTTDRNGELVFSGRRTCLYEAVDLKFSDCHSETLRVAHQERPSIYRNRDSYRSSFQYDVNDFDGSWGAHGYRGTHVECLDTEIDALPTVNLTSLTPDHLRANDDPLRARQSSSCLGYRNVQFFCSADPQDGESCFDVYEKSVYAAPHSSTQEDYHAIGKSPDTYLQRTTAALVSHTELALCCSAAELGILFLLSMYYKEMGRQNSTFLTLAMAVPVQFISYTLEALPLHIALGSEIKGSDWHSLFAFVDATLGSDATGETGILIVTTLLGDVQYHTTRVKTVAILTATFDLMAFSIVAMMVWRKRAVLAAHLGA